MFVLAGEKMKYAKFSFVNFIVYRMSQINVICERKVIYDIHKIYIPLPCMLNIAYEDHTTLLMVP